jgi:hypothetical protein
MYQIILTIFTLGVFVAGALSARAADPVAKCQSAKVKAMGKYVACRTKTEAKAALRGLPVDTTRLAKCADKFVIGWAKAGLKGAGECVDPPGADAALAEATSALYADWAAGYVAGGEADICDYACAPCEADLQTCEGDLTMCGGDLSTCQGDLVTCETNALCGNGVIEVGEDCDVGDLNGETCATQGQFGDGLDCGPGCVFDTSGCSATRYEDTGLGSVIDHQTGLEWQKTDDLGGLTDKDNTYRWSASSDEPDGTAFTEFLYGLNDCESSGGATVTSGGYAGHCDWRMPQIDELLTTVDCSFGNPCIDQSVFGPTASEFYWSASTYLLNSADAWSVSFNSGNPVGLIKDFTNGVRFRAVRGGS